MIKKWARILGVGAGLVLLLYQIYQSIRSISSFAFHVVWQWLFLAYLAMLLLIALQILIWKQILNAMGIPLGYVQIAKGYTLSLIPRYIPGSVWGYLNRSEWLRETYQVPASRGNISSLLEVVQIILTACMALFLFTSVFSTVPFWIFSLVFLLVFLLPLLAWKIVSLPIILRNRLVPFEISLGGWLMAGYFGVIQWILLGISTIFLLIGVGALPFEYVTLRKGALISFCYTFSWLVGFLVLFVPSGMGIRELSLSFLLTHLVYVPEVQSTWVAVLSRVLYSLAELTWVFISLFLNSKPRSREIKKG
ncbi:MAG: hypothetical protein QXS27_08175 [Candidatus Jordarchaeaceae archaeon]